MPPAAGKCRRRYAIPAPPPAGPRSGVGRRTCIRLEPFWNMANAQLSSVLYDTFSRRFPSGGRFDRLMCLGVAARKLRDALLHQVFSSQFQLFEFGFEENVFGTEV